MKERLAQILEEMKLSRNDFALKIGVQRSNITHVLDGRNKPGLDFIEKTISAFPQVNVEWLMTGKGTMLKTPVMQSMFQPDPIDSPKIDFNDAKKVVEKIESKRAEKLIETVRSDKGKVIEKLIVIYSDKTFDSYMPQ